MILKKGDLGITTEEADLVNLVKQVREDEYILGKGNGVFHIMTPHLKNY